MDLAPAAILVIALKSTLATLHPKCEKVRKIRSDKLTFSLFI